MFLRGTRERDEVNREVQKGGERFRDRRMEMRSALANGLTTGLFIVQVGRESVRASDAGAAAVQRLYALRCITFCTICTER